MSTAARGPVTSRDGAEGLRAFAALVRINLFTQFFDVVTAIVLIATAAATPEVALFVLPVMLTAAAMMDFTPPGGGTEGRLPVSRRVELGARLATRLLLLVGSMTVAVVVAAWRAPSTWSPFVQWAVLSGAWVIAGAPDLWRALRVTASRREAGIATAIGSGAVAALAVYEPELGGWVTIGVGAALVLAWAIVLWAPRPFVLEGPAMGGDGAVTARGGDTSAAAFLPTATPSGAGLGTWGLLRLGFAGHEQRPLLWLFWPLLLAFSSITYSGGSISTPLMVFVPTYVSVATTAWTLRLPISHRQRLIMLLVRPSVLLMALACGAPWPRMSGFSDDAWKIRGDDWTTYDSPTLIPLTYWASVQGSRAPRIDAPWGESVEPYEQKIGPWHFYNPYTTRRESSARFRDWQYARATARIYGAPLQNVRGREWWPLRITQRWSMLVLNGGLLATGILLLLIGAVQQLRNSARSVGWGAMTIWSPLLLMFLDFFYMRSGPLVWPLVQRALLQLDDALPTAVLPHALVVLAIALVPVALLLRALERQLMRSELPVVAPSVVASRG